MADSKKSGTRSSSATARSPSFAQWSRTFLAHLAESSNVRASARKAGISKTTAYETRRKDAQFNRAWQEALYEGYQHLEMETLQRLRSGQLKPKNEDQRRVRTFENSTAIRLLLAHRQSAARQEAIRDNRDADAILASIDAKLDRMRERSMEQTRRDAAFLKATDDSQ